MANYRDVIGTLNPILKASILGFLRERQSVSPEPLPVSKFYIANKINLFHSLIHSLIDSMQVLTEDNYRQVISVCSDEMKDNISIYLHKPDVYLRNNLQNLVPQMTEAELQVVRNMFDIANVAGTPEEAIAVLRRTFDVRELHEIFMGISVGVVSTFLFYLHFYFNSF